MFKFIKDIAEINAAVKQALAGNAQILQVLGEVVLEQSPGGGEILGRLNDVDAHVMGTISRQEALAGRLDSVGAHALTILGNQETQMVQAGKALEALRRIEVRLGLAEPPVEPPAVYELLWDPLLVDLGATCKRVDGAHYRLIAAWCTINGSWQGVPDWAKQYQMDTLGGDHHCYGRCLDRAGAPIDKTFLLSWPGGADSRLPEADGWANLPLAGQNWDPTSGPGPYTWAALRGDVLVGLGMPHNHHWSFFGVWKEV